MKRETALTLHLLIGLAAFASVHADIVYDNPRDPRPGLFASSPCGDQITLAGQNRILIALSIGAAKLGGLEGTASFQLTLYHNDGPDGRPQTILWQSPWYVDYPLAGNDARVTFQIPNLRVPDTFTWILEIEDPMDAACRTFGAGPAVGACTAYHWTHYLPSDTWIKTDYNGLQPSNFACQVVALPRSITPPGDFDRNHIIDLKDFQVLAARWLMSNVDPADDVIPDQTVNLTDLRRMLELWLYDCRCMPCRIVCRSRLHTLGIGIQLYANDNRGHFPSSLQELADYLEEEEELAEYLVCPCGNDVAPEISYAYRGEGLSDWVSSATILLYDKAGRHFDCPDIRNVLFADGHVAEMDEQAFQDAIEQDNLWRQSRGLPELPVE